MKKTIRLTESDLIRIIKRVISEQEFKPEEGAMNDEIKYNQLINPILPQKGYKKFFNLPEAGAAANFCDKPNMDGCSAWKNGNKIVVVGEEGFSYFNNKPDGIKNGPFTYSEMIKYL